jgi:hypothetical protein
LPIGELHSASQQDKPILLRIGLDQPAESQWFHQRLLDRLERGWPERPRRVLMPLFANAGEHGGAEGDIRQIVWLGTPELAEQIESRRLTHCSKKIGTT